MSKANRTKAALLGHARQQFWSKGFSNVALREIAGAAGVDVALISRYFGSKRGLFDATLEDLPTLDSRAIENSDALIDVVVDLFVAAPRDGSRPSATTLILVNAGDPEVGDAIRKLYDIKWQRQLHAIIGDEEKAALFTAAMFGMSVAEKRLHLSGIAPPQSDAYRAQLRGILTAALAIERAG